ncbi:MAG TPA: hypothetical protein PLD37_06220, partial [Usitatibacteraceae bacterium]|nr:hypothetical protein [Usitatibacteraceae bacterium]
MGGILAGREAIAAVAGRAADALRRVGTGQALHLAVAGEAAVRDTEGDAKRLRGRQERKRKSRDDGEACERDKGGGEGGAQARILPGRAGGPAVLQRFRDVERSKGSVPFEIGDRPGDPQHAMVPPRRQRQTSARIPEQLAPSLVGPRMALEIPTRELRVGDALPFELRRVGLRHPRPHHPRRLAWRRDFEIRLRKRRHLHVQVDAIEQR